MSNLYAICILIIVLEFYFTAYLLYFRKQVHLIMKKEGVNISEKVDGLNDYKSIYVELKKNNKLSRHDRRILGQHLIITLSAIILWVLFVYIVFFTDW